jgi:hypothetical protein
MGIGSSDGCPRPLRVLCSACAAADRLHLRVDDRAVLSSRRVALAVESDVAIPAALSRQLGDVASPGSVDQLLELHRLGYVRHLDPRDGHKSQPAAPVADLELK